MNNRKIFIIAVIFLATLVFVKLLLAQPPTFHQFYGNIVYPNGTVVTQTVSIDSILNGNFATSGVSEANGRYGYDPLFVIEGGANGDLIDFYVDDFFAGNYTFSDEGITLINLVYDSSAAVFCTDADSDGYNSTGGACGLMDRNDNVVGGAGIHPGATDVCGDGIDQDCSGSDASCTNNNDGGDDSGGGGQSKSFSLDKNNISLSLSQGETKQVSFTVTDAGVGAGTVQVSSSDLDMVSTASAALPLKGSVPVSVGVTASTDKTPGIYTGHIDVQVKTAKKKINLFVEVVSNDNIFDVILDTPDGLTVRPGEDFEAKLILTRLAETSSSEVALNFVIKDVDGNTISTQTDTINVEDFAEFSKEIKIPPYAVEGDYILYVQADYGGKVASASKGFIVKGGSISSQFDADTLWFILVLALIVSIVLVVVIIYVVRAKERKMLSVSLQ